MTSNGRIIEERELKKYLEGTCRGLLEVLNLVLSEGTEELQKRPLQPLPDADT
jgi:hypothetical protein